MTKIEITISTNHPNPLPDSLTPDRSRTRSFFLRRFDNFGGSVVGDLCRDSRFEPASWVGLVELSASEAAGQTRSRYFGRTHPWMSEMRIGIQSSFPFMTGWPMIWISLVPFCKVATTENFSKRDQRY